jgi:hypothetical protein
MKIEFDPQANAIYLRLFKAKVVDSAEIEPGIIYDYDANDKVIGIEILGIQQINSERLKQIDFPLKKSEQQELICWLDSLCVKI